MYSFRQGDYENWLKDFAEKWSVPVKDNLLRVPAHLGKGIILAQNISPDLSYLIMHFQLEKELEFQREAGGSPGFTLAFNQLESGDGRKPFRNDILLSDTRDNLQTNIPAGALVKKLIIFFSKELATQFLPGDLLSQLETFARENSFSANKYFISLPHRETLKDIFDAKENDPLASVRRLTSIVQLTEKFLHSFQRRDQASQHKAVKKGDLESMQHVEQILSSKLEGFPSLESLAHAVFMSTSKLKNLFKQVYGYTLYDYYNKSRLQRAKEMLVTGQCSIKQAGSEIGFSNLSHFAKAFKREFGFLPREVVRAK
jgi:AraC-like DNA-binding protein